MRPLYELPLAEWQLIYHACTGRHRREFRKVIFLRRKIARKPFSPKEDNESLLDALIRESLVVSILAAPVFLQYVHPVVRIRGWGSAAFATNSPGQPWFGYYPLWDVQ